MNSTNTHTPRPRRSAEQWQSLIDEWQVSGMPATQFCTERTIGYASFCQWRKRLATPDLNIVQDRKAEPDFIDLATLNVGSSSGWEIVLSLGNGVELKLSQS
ncbi:MULTISPECIES: IS66 family insertion sequence element accessory protein TnpB [unclassified Microbulbifer]|uniref:IS66 family insertion sequence element accessory protein TnpA n=1 Tax=unclassified Microbulbifer TaxID=2619833 RepID=UPI0027E3FA2C|nr:MULTISPECIES: IS66 family insertion sequence element accessory protein TnpB [unclassified Microbulbifer]